MTLIQVYDDVQFGSATWCALPCCLLADWGCCAVQLPNGAAGVCGGRGAAGVCGGRGAAGVCGGRMALQGVRLPNGAAVAGVCGGRVALQGVRRKRTCVMVRALRSRSVAIRTEPALFDGAH